MTELMDTKLSKSEKTRELILEKALCLFQKEGYESVTMRTLAEDCGLSLGSFYYHFKSKDEVISNFYKASLNGHIQRTENYLSTHRPSLESAMLWVCRDRIKEFNGYRSVLKVLAQRLDPEDPVSPWHFSSLNIRKRSVDLFELLVSTCLPSLDKKTTRLIARGLWLQHLAIIGFWIFDRSVGDKKTEAILKKSSSLWRKLPTLMKIPGVKTALPLFLSSLSQFEQEEE